MTDVLQEAERLPAASLPKRRTATRPDTAVAIVDFDNWHEARGDRPVEVSMSEVISHVTRRLLEVSSSTAYVIIRLYGGWTENGELSTAGSQMAVHLDAVNPFPIPLEDRLVHGEVHLATALSVDPTIELGALCRVRAGPPRVRLGAAPRPVGCNSPSDCAARLVTRFTARGTRQCPVDGCEVAAANAFATRQQKMVDTLMTCDLLHFAHDPDVVTITVVTADTDLMPPLAQALTLGSAKIMLQTNLDYWPADQLDTLRECGLIYFGPDGDGNEPA